MKSLKLFLNQNIKDIAIQVYGRADAVNLLLQDNPQLSMTNPFVKAGTEILYREGLYENPAAEPAVVEVLASRRHQPASGANEPCGIEFWYIEENPSGGTERTLVIEGECGGGGANPILPIGIGFDTIGTDNDIA